MSVTNLNKDVSILPCGEPESEKFILLLSADSFSLLIFNYGFTMWYRGTAECREVYAV